MSRYCVKIIFCFSGGKRQTVFVPVSGVRAWALPIGRAEAPLFGRLERPGEGNSTGPTNTDGEGGGEEARGDVRRKQGKDSERRVILQEGIGCNQSNTTTYSIYVDTMLKNECWGLSGYSPHVLLWLPTPAKGALIYDVAHSDEKKTPS